MATGTTMFHTSLLRTVRAHNEQSTACVLLRQFGLAKSRVWDTCAFVIAGCRALLVDNYQHHGSRAAQTALCRRLTPLHFHPVCFDALCIKLLHI